VGSKCHTCVWQNHAQLEDTFAGWQQQDKQVMVAQAGVTVSYLAPHPQCGSNASQLMLVI
jgi:hypothetical protein